MVDALMVHRVIRFYLFLSETYSPTYSPFYRVQDFFAKYKILADTEVPPFP